ncbi:MAG: hypothetical protein GXP10_08530 [Gammaproteobacteria bacterium]|nr:hypothetical protein [Gammaproteobacteria bacterium]
MHYLKKAALFGGGLIVFLGIVLVWQSIWWSPSQSNGHISSLDERAKLAAPLTDDVVFVEPMVSPESGVASGGGVVAESDPVADKLLRQAREGLNAVQLQSNTSGGEDGADDAEMASEVQADYAGRRADAATRGLDKLLAALNVAEGDDAKREAIAALWRYVGDVSGDIGVPQRALTALDVASRDSSAAVANEAARALADLQRFKQRMDEGPTQDEIVLRPPTPVQNEPATDDANPAQNKAIDDPEYQIKLAEYEVAVQQREVAVVQRLTEQLQTAQSDEERVAALQALSIQRNDAGVNAWLEIANDVHVESRYQAVQSLWHSAADGLDHDGRIAGALQQATLDSDERVAELAGRALADLENFKRTQEEALLAPAPSSESSASGDGMESGGDMDEM